MCRSIINFGDDVQRFASSKVTILNNVFRALVKWISNNTSVKIKSIKGWDALVFNSLRNHPIKCCRLVKSLIIGTASGCTVRVFPRISAPVLTSSAERFSRRKRASAKALTPLPPSLTPSHPRDLSEIKWIVNASYAEKSKKVPLLWFENVCSFATRTRGTLEQIRAGWFAHPPGNRALKELLPFGVPWKRRPRRIRCE